MIYLSTTGIFDIRHCATLHELKTMKKECLLCRRELDQNNPNSICFICVEKLTGSIALPQYYNVEEVRIILRLESQEQVRRLARQGKLPATRQGKSYLFPKKDFDTWLNSGQPAIGRKKAGEAEKAVIPQDAAYGIPPGEVMKSKTYEETEHKQKMRELAKQLQSAIILPWIVDSFLSDLQPRQLLLGKEGLPISIATDRTIHVQGNLEGEAKPTYLWHGLRSHFQTSSFSDLLDMIRLWRKEVGDNLLECHKLLEFLRRKLQKTFNTSIPMADIDRHGFTLWFPTTVLADAVEQAQWSTHFGDFPYRLEASGLRFGAWLIYHGYEDEDLKLYEDAHSELRSRCATWKQTKRIGEQRRELYRTVTEIKERLGQFTDMERLPGHCELCSASNL
jgi:excisionase family DNA binding protein